MGIPDSPGYRDYRDRGMHIGMEEGRKREIVRDRVTFLIFSNAARIGISESPGSWILMIQGSGSGVGTGIRISGIGITRDRNPFIPGSRGYRDHWD